MNDFKTRLIEEEAQLVEKIEKLESFLQGDKSKEIDQIQLILLGIQLPAMVTYLKCLNERLSGL